MIIFFIILVIDIIFLKVYLNFLYLMDSGFFLFFKGIFDSIEKYLFEFDYLNPYKILMLEGLIA